MKRKREARELMSATNNLLKPADGSPILNISQDIVLGCYYLTHSKPAAQVKEPKHYALLTKLPCYEAGAIMLQTPIYAYQNQPPR